MRRMVWIVAAFAVAGVLMVIVGYSLPIKHVASRTLRIPDRRSRIG